MPALSPLANPSATKAVLSAFGLSTKHALGQNFLVNDGIVQKIISLAEVDSSDSILEIGPGIGTLTIALLKNARHVTSIEFDKDLPCVLEQTLAEYLDRWMLITADAMNITTQHLEETGAPLPTKLVSNLPYAISTAVLLQYAQTMPHLQSATVMVQREVADRICAQPGTKDYGAYTVKLALLMETAGTFPVGHGNFMPPPKVESAVIRLNRRTLRDEQGNTISEKAVRQAGLWAEAAFTLRRKTIANSCRHYFGGRGEAGQRLSNQLPDILEACGIDSRRRGETLSLDEFVRLGMETC